MVPLAGGIVELLHRASTTKLIQNDDVPKFRTNPPLPVDTQLGDLPRQAKARGDRDFEIQPQFLLGCCLDRSRR